MELVKQVEVKPRSLCCSGLQRQLAGHGGGVRKEVAIAGTATSEPIAHYA